MGYFYEIVKRLFLVFLFNTFVCNAFSQQALEQFGSKVNGEVNAIEVDEINDIVYLGGDFNRAGTLGHYGALMDTLGIVRNESDFPNESVFTSLPDGNGGYFIGGRFTKVGDQTRNRLAHIDNMGKVSNWGVGINLNNDVHSMVRLGDTLFVGGDFSAFDAFNNSYGALLNKDSASITMDFPIIEGIVRASLGDNHGGFFIGGEFTKVGGLIRNHLAHIDSAGNVTSWNPNADGVVFSLEIIDNIIYAGGAFERIGEIDRSRIAAIDCATGVATNWNPNADGNVLAIHAEAELVYLGGDFVSVGGQARSRIAAINRSTGTATDWNPNADNSVTSIDKNGESIYVGGSFNNIGGMPRSYFAEINKVSGNATSLSANIDNLVRKVLFYNDTIFISGRFRQVNLQGRNGIAALNSLNGDLLNWEVNINSSDIVDMLVDDDVLYIAGNFRRNNTGQDTVVSEEVLGALNINDASFLHLDIEVNFNSLALTLSKNSSSLFVGGIFSSIGGQIQRGVVAIDVNTGSVNSWNPNINGIVRSLALGSGFLYIGGRFSQVGEVERENITAVDQTTAIPTNWNPSSNNIVHSMLFENNVLYVSGSFTTIGSLERRFEAALNLTTGTATGWVPSPPRGTRFLPTNDMFYEPIRNVIYLGGAYGIIAVDPDTGESTNWNPGVRDLVVESIFAENGLVYAGGSDIRVFDDFTGNLVTNFSPMPTNIDLGFFRTRGVRVFTIQSDGETIYAGGNFDMVGGSNRRNFAAFNRSTGLLLPWVLDPSDEIESIVSDKDSLVYVGGRFNFIGGERRICIAAININSGRVSPWNPDITRVTRPGSVNIGSVNDIAINNGLLYFGGNFTAVGGVSRSGLVSVDIETAILDDWNPNLESNGDGDGVVVTSIQIQNDTLYAGGLFSDAMGEQRRNLASFDLVRNVLTDWSPSFDGNPRFSPININKLLISDSVIYVGGRFTALGGQFRENIAALDIREGLATDWIPSVDNEFNLVRDIIFDGPETLIVGGIRASESLNSIVSLNVLDGSNTGLTLNLDMSGVNALAFDEGNILVGGSFGRVENIPSIGFTIIPSLRSRQNIEFVNIPNKVYGDSQFVLEANSNTENTILFESSDSSVVSINGNLATITGAGNTSIIARQLEDGDFIEGGVAQRILVESATLNVGVSDTSIVYGQTPKFTLNYTGFVNNEDILTAQITEPEVNADIRQIGESVIALSDGEAANYNLILSDGILNVNRAVLRITANDQEIIYGENPPELTATYEGFQFEDSVSTITPPSITTNATSNSPVGVYDILLSRGASEQYDLELTNGMLNVNKRMLDVVAEDHEKLYGDEIPQLDFQLIGFVNNDTQIDIEELPAVSTTASPLSVVGSYPIELTGGSDENYTFNFLNGVLTVGKATLIATPLDVVITFGDDEPNYEIRYEGFANNETFEVIDLEPTASLTSNLGDAGFYEIIIEGGIDNNYDFQTNTGELEVVKATLTATPSDAVITFGDDEPNYDIIYEGFVNNESSEVIDSEPIARLSTDLGDAGVYEIIIEGGFDNNYNFQTNAGELKVLKANLSIIAEDKEIIVDGEVPEFTLAFEGFKFNDDELDLDQLPVASINIVDTSTPGLFDITLEGGNDNNYSYSLFNGTLSINQVLSIFSEISNRFYPNPTSSSFSLEVDNIASFDSIVILDMSGKEVKRFTSVEQYYAIDELKEGVYLLLLNNDGKSSVLGRIVKKNR